MKFTEVRFTDLPIPEELQRGLAEAGFRHLTPVQARSLPLTLQGTDLAVQAQTGSGKTAVFLITLFSRMLAAQRPETRGVCPRALILTPTRELAVQVARDAETIGAFLPFRTLAAFGGADYRKQREDIAQGVDVLVGTPGRLIDYLKQRVYHLKDLEFAVIDEADRMFDMGFIADIRYMMRRMSSYDRRQSLLFSATLADRVMELSYEYMNAPGLVEIEPDKVTAERVEQVLFHVSSSEKIALLIGLLRSEPWTKVLVFVNTKRAGGDLVRWLSANGVPSALLSGDVDQKKRLAILRRFMAGEVSALVATDVASRGLHVENISHVVNYDLPQSPEDYVHRIGRTARVGAAGKAISLACENYVYSLEAIEEYIGRKLPVAWADTTTLEADVQRPPPSKSRPPRAGGPRTGDRRGRTGAGQRRGKPGARGRKR